MKHFIICLWIAAFAVLFALLGSCTEEVIKFVKIHDTVFVKSPPVMSFVQTTHVDTVYRDLVIVDTVEVTLVVHDTVINQVVVHDTVLQVKTDSVFIERVVEKVVNHYDTIIVTQIINHTDTIYIDKIVTIHDTVEVIEYEQTVVYLSTTYIFPGNSVTFIPTDLQPIHDKFIQDAQARGKSLAGGDLVITYVPADDLPGENWTSSGTEMSGFQYVIYLSETLTQDLAYSALYRELARWQLKKKYSNDANKIMSPLFPVTQLKYSDSDAKKAPYLAALFN